MAQGAIKKSAGANKSAPRRSTSSSGPKRGHRVIKPKKLSLIKKEKISKKHSAGLVARTERSLAEKAGHLEMLKGGKKEQGEKAKQKGK